MPFARGAKPSPRHKLCGATPFLKAAPLPLNFGIVPPQLSFWGNSQDGDCVSAEEYFAKAAYAIQCGLPELFGTEQECIAFARQHGYLNGATLTDVMDTMAQAGAPFGGQTYKDGPYKSVDYSNLALIAGALQVGPIKIGIDANGLPSGAGNGNGWYGFGGSPGQYPNMDHCVAICGQGTAAYCFGLLQTPVPAGVDPNKADCLLLFTWSGIGVIDLARLVAMCGEAWVRNPTTVGQTPVPPVAYVPPFKLFEGGTQFGLVTGYPDPASAHAAAQALADHDKADVTVKDAAGVVVETVAPTPPAPLVVTGTASGVLQIPVGPFGRVVNVQVNLPVVGTAAPAKPGAGPWGNLAALLLKVAPTVIADLEAGKSLSQIVADVEAALLGNPAAQKLTPDQWQQIIAFVMQLIALFGHH